MIEPFHKCHRAAVFPARGFPAKTPSNRFTHNSFASGDLFRFETFFSIYGMKVEFTDVA